MALKTPLSGVKGLIRSGASLAYYATGHHRRANLGQFVVLMYHRVLRDDDPYIPYIQPGMYVRESSFEKQLQFLTDNYQVVSLQQMLELIDTGQASNNRQYCVITFDDGWRDNYQCAFPLLKKFSVPATIFLTASFVGTNRFFWHEKISRLFYLARSQGKRPASAIAQSGDAADALLMGHILSREGSETAVDAAIEGLKALPVSRIEEVVAGAAAKLGISLENERTMLSWEEIREMGKNGISFGSHTCEHRILTQVELPDAAEEIGASMAKLRSKELDLNYVPVFCYPNGRYNQDIRSLVIDAGYSAAVTTKLGRQSRDLKDPFAISRIGVHEDIAHSKPLFSFRLRAS
jgi:peptidoglycan/xylan/chitin deacetylase (PgdA/CDA1 family)